MLAQPARREANTAPPRPASLRNSLRSIDPLIAVSFWNKPAAGLIAGPTLQDRGSRAFIPGIFFLSRIPRARIQFAPLSPEESRGNNFPFLPHRRPCREPGPDPSTPPPARRCATLFRRRHHLADAH